MSSNEVQSVSYLAAIRKVVLPSPDLEQFYDQLVVDARETVGFGEGSTVILPETLERQLQPGYQPRYEKAIKLNAEIFPVRSLRVVLFARRATASQEVNKLLFNAHARLTNTEYYPGRSRKTPTGRRQKKSVPNRMPHQLEMIQQSISGSEGNLAVTSSNVVRTASVDALEQSYALQVDGPSLGSNVLMDQQDAIYNETRKIQAMKGLLGRQQFAADVDPLTLQIASIPGSRNRDNEYFEEAANLHNTISFELSPVEWHLKLESPSKNT